MEDVNTVLGVIGLVFFIACVIALAALVTAAVVRISPTPDKSKPTGSDG
jgi:FlaG/FlaF family flagellin (archaellin)